MAMADTADGKPSLEERYRTAVHTSNLGSEARSFRSDSDVVGAMGLADKHLTTGRDGKGNAIRESPLSVPLERLFAGDTRASTEIVTILAGMLWSKAEVERIKPKVTRVEAVDVAKACLAWYRSGTCKACGGHGYGLIPGAPMLSERECPSCRGSGKMPFEDSLDPSGRHLDRRELGRWLLAEMERALGRAGPAAMNAIGSAMDL